MKLTIPIDTPPQERPRFNRYGNPYDPPKSRKFKRDFGLILMLMLGNHKPFTGAVRVILKICRNKKSAIEGFGDADNLAKIILDAITETGAVWLDDGQVTDLHIIKATAPNPSVELTIEEATNGQQNEDDRRTAAEME